MELFGKIVLATVAVVFVLAIVFGALVVFYHPVYKPLTSEQAEMLVLKDIGQQYPDAVANVISISKSNLTSDSWNMVFNVVFNSTKVCPEVTTEGFDYPATNLVPSSYAIYASGCKIYGYGTVPGYIVSNKYMAIVRAHESGNATILGYISSNSYNETSASASYYSTANPYLLSIGINSTHMWIIRYNATDTDKVLYAAMYANGSIESTDIVNMSTATIGID